MSHAIIAILLIRLDARCGEWVTVRDLAEHFNLLASNVELHLRHMCEQGLVQLQLVDGDQLHAARVTEEATCA